MIDTAMSISNLASLRQAQSRLEEAESLYREALESRQKCLTASLKWYLRKIVNLICLLFLLEFFRFFGIFVLERRRRQELRRHRLAVAALAAGKEIEHF